MNTEEEYCGERLALAAGDCHSHLENQLELAYFENNNNCGACWFKESDPGGLVENFTKVLWLQPFSAALWMSAPSFANSFF